MHSPLDVQSSEDLFATRLAEIHGLAWQQQEGRRDRKQEMDTREAEVRAMFEAFLGADYDELRIRKVLDIQEQVRKAQPVLLETYEAGRIPAEVYARSFNQVFKNSMVAIEQVLGRVDFEKLFGCPADETADLIDPAEFVKAEAEQRQAPPPARRYM